MIHDIATFEPLKKRGWGRSNQRFECGDKKRYRTRTEAKSAVRGLKLSGEQMHDYLCRWCSYYHVGHQHL
jgi:hypothetical protein